MDKYIKETIEALPEAPGVYMMYSKDGDLLYVGKAGNLKKRVSSYFHKAHDKRIEELVKKIDDIKHKETDSVLDALILESKMIKDHQPIFNVREKDDKSFLWVEITKEEYPRVLLTRGSEKDMNKNKKSDHFGPFVYASEIRRALRVLRKIFPYNTHGPDKVGNLKRPCLNAELGLCPGTCVSKINKKEYKKTISELKKVLKGGKRTLIRNMDKEMKKSAKDLDFERAQKLKRRIFSLQHIHDTALISDNQPKIKSDQKEKIRIEGYDISNISGTSATGSMVVFYNDQPSKDDYRKFKVKTIKGQNDTGMLKEVLERRFSRYDEGSNKNQWPLPDLILIDGGKGQVNTAIKVLEEKGFRIPVVGIAKGVKRKKNEFIGKIPGFTNEKTLIRVRDEAHRFAVSYHKKLRKGF